MIRHFLIGILFSLTFIAPCLGAIRNWDGNGVSPTVYGNADNWVENAIPTPSDIAQFPNATNTNVVLSNTSPGAAYGVLGLNFTTPTNNYVFTIQNAFRTLNVGVSGIANTGGQTHTFNINTTGILNIGGPTTSSNLTFNVSAGTLNFVDAGSVSNGTFNVNNSGFINFTEDSTSLGGTFNVGETGQLRFIGSSNPTAGTINIASVGISGGNVLFNIDGVVGEDLVINNTEYAEISIVGINNLLFNGVLTGGGGLLNQASLDVDGTGTITFTSDSSTFLGNTLLHSGPTFVLTGSLGGNLTGLMASRLEGSGTIGGDVEILGTISPQVNGLATTMNILGDLTFTDGRYQALIDENGDNSLINAASATINNSELNVLIESLPGLEPTDYLVLSAPTVSGPFPIFTSNLTNPLVNIQQIYQPSAIYVRLFVPKSVCVTTPNEYDVLNSLASIVTPNIDQTIVLNNLNSLDCEPFAAALNQMSGEQYTTLINITNNASDRFANRIRMASRSRVFCQNCCDPDIFGWFDGGGGRSSYSGDSYAEGLDTSYFSLAGGLQLLTCCGWTVGGAAYYEKDNLDYDLNGHATCKIYQGAVFASYNGPSGYFLADFVFGINHFDVQRRIVFAEIDRLANSSGKVYNGTFYTELGYTLNLGCMASQLYIGADTGCYYQNGFDERDALSLSLEVDSTKYYRSDAMIGSRFLWNLPCSMAVEFDVDYRHRFGVNRIDVITRFVDVDTPMRIKGFGIGRDAIEGTLALVWNASSNLQLYLRGCGEAWSNYSDYNGTAGFVYHW